MLKVFKVLLISVLFINSSLVLAQKDAKTAVEDPITRLFGETNEIRTFVSETDKRTEQIKSFKIKFTNLITDLASQDFYKIEYQQSFQEVNQLEKEALKWKDEEKNFSEKTSDLLTVVKQSLQSYKESISNSKGEQRYEISQNIKDLSRIKTRLRNYQLELQDHHKRLDQFLGNINDWKELLREKMTKSFNKNFTRWEPNQFIMRPIESVKILVEQIQSSIAAWVENIKEIVWKDKLAPLFLIIAFSIAVFWATFFFIGKLYKVYHSFEGLVTDDFLGRVFDTVLKRKQLVALWISFLFSRYLGYKFFPENPHLIFFAALFLLLIVSWVKLKEHLLEFAVDIIGESRPEQKRINRLIFLTLLISLSRALQAGFYLKSELMIFIDTVILGYISFQLSKYIFRNLSQKENTSVSQTMRTIVWIISLVIFASTIMELIGFVHLSRVVQEVVLENASIVIFLWFVFGVVDNFMRFYLDHYKARENYNKFGYDIVLFFKELLGKIFIILLGLVIIQSWMKNVFVFSDFWNVSLISFSDYELTIIQPIQVLALYYFLRAFYLVFKYIFYTFLLKSLKIEKKNAPNILSIVRYLLIFLFISMGLALLGFTYKNILIFASALGVGIGFGLQNIVNNFLSGIILLFEQPVRVGDVIEVEGIFATVINIGMRSTIVESLDNSSIIIPNSVIVSNNLINWTLQDNVIAVECYVGVAYGTDTRLVSGLLLEALKGSRDVLEDPSPQIWFKEFGDSSLNFTVRFWINKPREKFFIQSRIMHAINNQLRQHNITIPFPQRDLHIHGPKTITKTVEVRADDHQNDENQESENDK